MQSVARAKRASAGDVPVITSAQAGIHGLQACPVFIVLGFPPARE